MDRICTKEETGIINKICIINKVCKYLNKRIKIFPFYFSLCIDNTNIKFAYISSDASTETQETLLQVLRNAFNEYFTKEYIIEDKVLYIPYDDIYKLYVMLKLKGDVL